MKRFIIDGMTVDEALVSLAANGNRKFTESLHPGISNILGLRLPDIRALAKRIAKHPDVYSYLSEPDGAYMESQMLHGLVLGQIKVNDTDLYLKLVAQFVPKICSWSICDCFDFAGKERFVSDNREAVRNFLLQWLDSEREYEVRFGVVMLMKNFLKIDGTLSLLHTMERVVHQAYYVKMAVAWAVSVACVHDADATLKWLAEGHLSPTTNAMAIRKIRESLRISSAEKERASSLRNRVAKAGAA